MQGSASDVKGTKLKPAHTRVADLTGAQLSAIVTGAVFKALFAFALIGALFGALALVLSGCSSGDDGSGEKGGAATVCDPGRSESCIGPGGCLGGQACNPDGTGFGECECSADGTGGVSGSVGSSSGGAGQEAPSYCESNGLQCSCYRDPSECKNDCDQRPCDRAFCCWIEPTSATCSCLYSEQNLQIMVGKTCAEYIESLGSYRVEYCG